MADPSTGPAFDSTGGGDEGLADLAAVVRSALGTAPPATKLDRDRWRRHAELGWLSLLVPEALGGAGADERAAAVVARGIGRSGGLEPHVASVLAALCLSGLPATPAVTEALGRVLAGADIAVLAWQDESGDGDLMPEPLPVRARYEDGCVVLTGTAWWVPTASADEYLVVAEPATDAEPLLVRVTPADAGVTVVPAPAADGTSWARLELADARLPVAEVLGGGEPLRDALRAAIDTGALLCAAELVGLVDRMLELTVAYLGSRRQFGRTIGSFQVLQHRAVDMWVQQRLADAALDGALRRVTEPGADPGAGTGLIRAETRALAASSAKARASAAALRVANEAVQLHGAIGFTDEYELGRYVNRALVLASWLGNGRTHTRRYLRLVAS